MRSATPECARRVTIPTDLRVGVEVRRFVEHRVDRPSGPLPSSRKQGRPRPGVSAPVDLQDSAMSRRAAGGIRRQDPHQSTNGRPRSEHDCRGEPMASPASAPRSSFRIRRLDVVPHQGTLFPPRVDRSTLRPDRFTDRAPRVRFHDLRHTHASLLVAAGVPIKVVSERLGHAHPAFTTHTYQHLLPGMSAAAAEQFATLVGGGTR